jgi:two-component system, OmpR family, response regulator RstA
MAHILLVDDDPEVVAVNTEAIQAAGHSVTTAADATEAVEAVRETTPDLVVLEAILGDEFAGVDLAHELADNYPGLPLIMLTRADEELSAEQIASQDTDEGWVPVARYLAKPVLGDVLTYEIEHLLASEQ